MANAIKVEGLTAAIQEQLTIYAKQVTEDVNAAGQTSARKLQRLTKATAPKLTGEYRKHISIAEQVNLSTGMKTYIWHVKAPDYRLTHLLVHGHATVNGGRTKADPFLHKALETVLPEYEEAVEEALKHD